jgi:hypothetical protein
MTSKVIVREVKLLESFKLSDQFWNLTGETITWQIKYSEDTSFRNFVICCQNSAFIECIETINIQLKSFWIVKILATFHSVIS